MTFGLGGDLTKPCDVLVWIWCSVVLRSDASDVRFPLVCAVQGEFLGAVLGLVCSFPIAASRWLLQGL